MYRTITFTVYINDFLVTSKQSVLYVHDHKDIGHFSDHYGGKHRKLFKSETMQLGSYVSYHPYKCHKQILDDHNVLPHSIALIFDLTSWQSLHCYYLGLYL